MSLPSPRRSRGRPTGRPRRGALAHQLGGWLVLGLLGLGAAALWASSATPTRAVDSPGQTSQSTIDAGARLFIQSCAACHGAAGQGTSVAPAIASVGGAAAVDFVLRTGRMPLSAPTQQMQRNPPAFDETQIRELDAFAATLGGLPIPSVDVTRGNISRGQSLFIQNCAACHAATGAGDAVGGGYVAPRLDQADPLTVAEAMRIGPGAMPVFNPKLYSQQAVDDIAAYVQYLRHAPSPGGFALAEVGPVAEGFVAIVVGLGLLLLVIRWIGRPRPGAAGAGANGGEAGGRTDGPAESGQPT